MTKKNLGGKTAAAGILFAAVIFAAFPTQTADAVRTAVKNCLEIIIPSLFALMVLSDMYIRSGLYKRTGKLSRFAAKHIFKISPQMAPVLLVSAVSGYPVGASLIAAAVRDGTIEKDEGERLLCGCFCAGPAFIYSAVGAGVFKSTRAGTAIFLSCLIANLIIGLFLAWGEKAPAGMEDKPKVSFNSELFCTSVREGGKSILAMCGIVIFVSAVLSIPDTLGLTRRLSVYMGSVFSADPACIYTALRSAAEISNIAYLKTDSLEMLPAAAALISFGGISVFMQIASVCKGAVKIGKMIVSRLFAAAASYFICKLIMEILSVNTAVSAMAQIKEVRHNSPISGVFLLIMTILLLSQKNVVKIKKM